MKNVLLVAVLLISGCGVNTAEVDNLKKENESLKSEKVDLNKKIVELEVLNGKGEMVINGLNEDIEKYEKEIEELKNSVVIEESVKEGERLFEKKKKCADSQYEIIKDINDPEFIYAKGHPELEEIFYSSKRNSCLYVFSYFPFEAWGSDCDNEDLSFKYCMVKNQRLIDFLTKETITEKNLLLAKSCEKEHTFDCVSILDENDKFDELKK